jgi:hypothetical protein
MSFRWRSVAYSSCFVISLVSNPLTFSAIMRRRSVRCSKTVSFCFLLCFSFNLRVSLLFCEFRCYFAILLRYSALVLGVYVLSFYHAFVSAGFEFC